MPDIKDDFIQAGIKIGMSDEELADVVMKDTEENNETMYEVLQGKIPKNIIEETGHPKMSPAVRFGIKHLSSGKPEDVIPALKEKLKLKDEDIKYQDGRYFLKYVTDIGRTVYHPVDPSMSGKDIFGTGPTYTGTKEISSPMYGRIKVRTGFKPGKEGKIPNTEILREALNETLVDVAPSLAKEVVTDAAAKGAGLLAIASGAGAPVALPVAGATKAAIGAGINALSQKIGEAAGYRQKTDYGELVGEGIIDFASPIFMGLPGGTKAVTKYVDKRYAKEVASQFDSVPIKVIDDIVTKGDISALAQFEAKNAVGRRTREKMQEMALDAQKGLIEKAYHSVTRGVGAAFSTGTTTAPTKAYKVYIKNLDYIKKIKSPIDETTELTEEILEASLKRKKATIEVLDNLRKGKEDLPISYESNVDIFDSLIKQYEQKYLSPKGIRPEEEIFLDILKENRKKAFTGKKKIPVVEQQQINTGLVDEYGKPIIKTKMVLGKPKVQEGTIVTSTVKDFVEDREAVKNMMLDAYGRLKGDNVTQADRKAAEIASDVYKSMNNELSKVLGKEEALVYQKFNDKFIDDQRIYDYLKNEIFKYDPKKEKYKFRDNAFNKIFGEAGKDKVMFFEKLATLDSERELRKELAKNAPGFVDRIETLAAFGAIGHPDRYLKTGIDVSEKTTANPLLREGTAGMFQNFMSATFGRGLAHLAAGAVDNVTAAKIGRGVVNAEKYIGAPFKMVPFRQSVANELIKDSGAANAIERISPWIKRPNEQPTQQ